MAADPRATRALPVPRRRRWSRLPPLAVLLLALSVHPGHAADRLTLCTFVGPPLSRPDRTGMVDLLLAEAFDRVDLSFDVVQLPEERSLASANAGTCDGEFVRIGGLQRLYPHLVQVPEKLLDFEFVAFTKHVHFQPEGWESLQPYRVGIVIGWKILEENITAPASRVGVRSKDLLFSLLDRDQIDVAVYSRLLGYEVVHRLGLQDLRALEPPLATREMFLYLHEKHAALTAPIARALNQMKTEGFYLEVRDRTLGRYRDLVAPQTEGVP